MKNGDGDDKKLDKVILHILRLFHSSTDESYHVVNVSIMNKQLLKLTCILSDSTVFNGLLSTRRLQSVSLRLEHSYYLIPFL